MIERLLLQIEVNNKQAMKGFKDVENKLSFLNQKAQGIKSGLMGAGFAGLFLGMAIQRLGKTILSSLVKTYLEATNYQSRFNQELMAVQASFEFLKFSIMDALGNSDLVIAMIEGLINMVNWISEFVNQHPKLALIIGGFILLAIVFGTILMVVGQVFLGILGIIGFGELIAPILAGIAAIGLGPILLIIGLIIAVVAILWTAWQTNFGNIQEFTKETFGILYDLFVDIFSKVWGILKGLFKLISGVLTGDFSKVWEGFTEIAINAIGLVINAFIRLGASVANLGIFIGNSIKESILGAMQSVFDMVNKTLAWIEKKSKGKISFGGGMEIPDFAKQLLSPTAYITKEQVASATGVVDNLLGLGAPATPTTAQPISSISSSLGNLSPLSGQLGGAPNNNVSINVENMMADDNAMKSLFDKYATTYMDEMNNRFAGTTRGA